LEAVVHRASRDMEAWRFRKTWRSLWIFTFAMLVEGQVTTTSLNLLSLYSDDVRMQCATMGPSCPLQGEFPNRGFCVSSQKVEPSHLGQGGVCYDVCNPNHEPSEYTLNGNGENDLANHISQAMVTQVREGLNTNVSCPTELGLKKMMDRCPPGEECSGELRRKHKIPSGQGLCVVDGTSDSGQSCYDMCDYRHHPDRFAEGAHRGIALKVITFRNGGHCQANPWLPWVIGLVLLLVILVGCGIAVWSYRRQRGRRTGMLKDDLGDDGEEQDDEQEMPPFEDQLPQDPTMGGYAPEYGIPPRGSAGFEAPPPDPPLQHDMPDRLASTGASMPIPGLEEPHLPMPNLNLQLGGPPTSVQSGLPLQTSVSAISTSGQYLSAPYLGAPASPQAAFTTQLPSYPVTAGASPGSRVYTTTLPAQYATPSGSVHITPAPIVTVPQPYTSSYSLPPGGGV